jgi:hypothetical protein
MPSHLEFTRSFQTALNGEQPPLGAQAGDPSEITRRFNVYRNNVAYGLAQALARQFPATERLVGADCFAGAAQMFIEQHPPRSPILTDWGEEFPQFLAEVGSLSTLSYLPDVARIEWARIRAYHAADASPVDTEQLNILAQDHRMYLHPSVQILRLATPAGSIWASQQPKGPPPPTPEHWHPEVVLVARRGLATVITQVVTPHTAGFIHQLQAQQTLATACTHAGPEFDLTATLVLLIQNNLISNIT